MDKTDIGSLEIICTGSTETQATEKSTMQEKFQTPTSQSNDNDEFDEPYTQDWKMLLILLKTT